MRKNRCRDCGKTFYCVDPKIAQCQNCTGTQPDVTAQYEAETAAKQKANATTKSKRKQTVSVKELQRKDDDDAPAS